MSSWTWVTAFSRGERSVCGDGAAASKWMYAVTHG